MLEAHVQVFVSSPFFRNVDPCPTESLAFHVTGALLSLGLNFGDLHEAISDGIAAFISACSRAAESVLSPRTNDFDTLHLEDAIRTVTIAVALLGFLDAASAQADFWKAGGRTALIQRVRQLLSEPFLVAVNTSLSTIRNSHSHDRDVKQWKRNLRQYAASDRPLGAMLLQRSFMWLLASSTSLLVADAALLRDNHILDLLMSREGSWRTGSIANRDSDFHSVEVYANLAMEQMTYLDADADFVKIASPSEQKLAYAVKSAAIIAFLNCLSLNEEALDPDVLMNWLQETLADPEQMADGTLASVVLRCLALLCHLSPGFSSIVSRLLPRFLVQTIRHQETVAVASKSLAFVVKLLSKDGVISTLYTLGNVLSPDAEGAITDGQIDGLPIGENGITSIYAGRHSMGSSISLQMIDEEQTAMVYGNIVQAICSIASVCDDEKITALAQSMLLQKLDKMNTIIDAQIISGAAALALGGGQLEFRSLLKMYSRICHIGVVEKKDYLLDAVSSILNVCDKHILMWTGHESSNTHLCEASKRLAFV
jgi:phosphatidylinositol 4-kinase